MSGNPHAMTDVVYDVEAGMQESIQHSHTALVLRALGLQHSQTDLSLQLRRGLKIPKRLYLSRFCGRGCAEHLTWLVALHVRSAADLVLAARACPCARLRTRARQPPKRTKTR